MIPLDQMHSLDQFQQLLRQINDKDQQCSLSDDTLLSVFDTLQRTCDDPKKVHEVYQELKRIQVDAEHQEKFHQRIHSLALTILDFVLVGCDEKVVKANLQRLKSASKTVFNYTDDLALKEHRTLPVPCLDGKTLQNVVDYVQAGTIDTTDLENLYDAFRYLDMNSCKLFYLKNPDVIGPDKWREWGLQGVSETNAEAFAHLSDASIRAIEQKRKQKHVIFRIPPDVKIEALLELLKKKLPNLKILGSPDYLRYISESLQGEWVMMTEEVIPYSYVKGTASKMAVIKNLNDQGLQYDLPSCKQSLFFLIGHLFATGKYALNNHMVAIKDFSECGWGFGIGKFSRNSFVFQIACPNKFAVAACTL